MATREECNSVLDMVRENELAEVDGGSVTNITERGVLTLDCLLWAYVIDEDDREAIISIMDAHLNWRRGNRVSVETVVLGLLLPGVVGEIIRREIDDDK